MLIDKWCLSMLVVGAWWLGGLWGGGLVAFRMVVVVTWPEVAKDWESCSYCSPGARAEVGAAPAPQVQCIV